MKDFVKFYELDKPIHLQNLVRRIYRELWDKQNEICVRVEGYKHPVLTEDAYDIIAEIFDKENYQLRLHICMAFLDYFYRDIINPGDNRPELEDFFGWEYPDWDDDLPEEVYFKHNDEKMTRPAFIPF